MPRASWLQQHAGDAMKNSELEHWATSAVERLLSGSPNEDARVEFKREWIEPAKAARRLAGHANAARGERILWVIGADKERGPVGATHTDLADWWAGVKAEFDQVSPSLQDLNFSIGGAGLVALLFETDRAPYLVKNPAGGAIQFELPWRDGTAVRTARREEVLKLLQPVAAMPDVEVLELKLSAKETRDERSHQPRLDWRLEGDLYVTPHAPGGVVIPFHHCGATLLFPGQAPETLEWFEAANAGGNPRSANRLSGSSNVRISAREAALSGPGGFLLVGHAQLPPAGKTGEETKVEIELTLGVVGGAAPLRIPTLVRRPRSGGGFWWSSKAERYGC